MRALVVFAQPPSPEGTAAARVSNGLLRGLVEHGVDVTALAADLGPGRPGPPPPELGVEVVEVPNPRTLAGRVRRVTEPRGMLGRGALAQRVVELIGDSDVAHFDELDCAPLARAHSHRASLHLHFFGRRDRPQPRSIRTPGGREDREMLGAERRAWHATQHLVTSSPDVAEDIAAAGGPRATVMRLSLDPAAYTPGDPGGAPVAGLIGTAMWPPTRNAVEELLRDTWPRVRAQRPDAVLRLAGRGMTPGAFGGAQPPGVEWVGPVERAEDFLHGLGMLLYPLDTGSGAKVKTLEALACGVPVVTTASGAEGVLRGDGMLVGDGQDALVDHAVELLGDDDARRERGAAARAQFEAGHAPHPATAPLVALLERIAA